MGKIRTGGAVLKQKLSGHFINLFLLVILGSVIFLAGDTLMANAVVPAMATAKTVPIVSNGIFWAEGWAGTWNWDKIVIVFVALIGGILFDRILVARSKPEVTRKPLETVKAKAETVKSKVKETVSTADKTNAELETEIKTLETKKLEKKLEALKKED